MDCHPDLKLKQKYQIKDCYVKLTHLGDYDDAKWTLENTTSIYRNQKFFVSDEGHCNKVKVCQVCYKIFALASDWKIHMHFVHSNHPTLEETMHYSFIQKLSKSNHSTGEINPPHKAKKPRKWKKRKPRPRNYKCDMCGIAFDRPHVLRQHYEAVHLKLRPCRCRLCGERFSNKYGLLHHITVSHVATKRFECPLCASSNGNGAGTEDSSRPLTFSYRSTLLYHLKAVHYDGLMSMAGLQDRAMINNDSAPIVEVSPSIRVDTRGYECSTCGAVFKHQVHYKRHVRRKHGPPTSRFACHYCPPSSNQVQNSLEELRVQEHVDIDGRPTFSTAELLERHIKIIHLNLKPFVCSTCGQRYCDRGSLDLHAKRAHNPLVATNTCPVPGCDKTFTSILHMSRHFRTFHAPTTTTLKSEPGTEETIILGATPKPKFACSMCPRHYESEVTLARHVAWNHEGRRDFSCHLCGAAFAEKAKLHRHFASRKHWDVFTTPCHYCDRRFEGPTELSLHLEEVNNHAPKMKPDEDWRNFKYCCRLCPALPLGAEKQNGGPRVSSGDVAPADSDGVDKEPCPATRFRFFIELELHHQTVHPGQPMPVAPKKIVNPNAVKRQRKRKRNKTKIKIEPISPTEQADDNSGAKSKEGPSLPETSTSTHPELENGPEVQIVADEKGGKKKYVRKKGEPGAVILCEECGKTMIHAASLKRHKIRKHGYLKQPSLPKSKGQKSSSQPID